MGNKTTNNGRQNCGTGRPSAQFTSNKRRTRGCLGQYLIFSPVFNLSRFSFSTFPSCRAAGISGAGGPTGLSRGWAGCPCPPPRRSDRGSRRCHRSPWAGTSGPVWFSGTCTPRLSREPTWSGLLCGCAVRPAYIRRWCWWWTSTIRLPCLPSAREPEPLWRGTDRS